MKEFKNITETNVNILLNYLEKNKINCGVTAGPIMKYVYFQDIESKKKYLCIYLC